MKATILLTIASLFVGTTQCMSEKELKQEIRADLYNGVYGYKEKYSGIQRPDYSKMSPEEQEQAFQYQQSKCLRMIGFNINHALDIRGQNCMDVQNALIALLKKDKEQIRNDWSGKLNKLGHASDDLEVVCKTQTPAVPADMSRNDLKELQSYWTNVVLYNQALRVKHCEENKSNSKSCSAIKETFKKMLNFEQQLETHLQETK